VVISSLEIDFLDVRPAEKIGSIVICYPFPYPFLPNAFRRHDRAQVAISQDQPSSQGKSIVRDIVERADAPIVDEQGLGYEEWRASIISTCGQFDPAFVEPEAFVGWSRSLTIHNFSAAEVGSNSPRVERNDRHTRLDGYDIYGAVFQVRGTSFVAQHDEVVELKAGDLAVVDATKPLTFFQTNGVSERLCLHLPRQTLVTHLGFEPPAALSKRRTRAMRTLFQLVQHMDDDPVVSPETDAFMHLAVYDLLGAHLAPTDPQPNLAHTEKLFAKIRGIIGARFTDPDLGPGQVAAEAGISLRYLQKLFTVRGYSCGHFIQSLRLSRAEQLLRRRQLLDRDQPLSEIAFASGFSDYGFFSRKFQQRFGCAPGAHGGSSP
jgi:AraC family transcriptional activator of tynA and feaB